MSKPAKAAFPFYVEGATSGVRLRDPGMSLRDYFAAKAMQGFISSGGVDWRSAVELSYQTADAMLEERRNYGSD